MTYSRLLQILNEMTEEQLAEKVVVEVADEKFTTIWGIGPSGCTTKENVIILN